MTEHAITRSRLHRIAGLRTIFRMDALTCLAMGLLLISFAEALGRLLGLPARLLLVAGLVLLPCAALMYATARSEGPNRFLGWLVVLGNFAWVLASIGVVILLAPPMPGIVFLLGQAAAVALLGAIEYRGLRAGAD